ncbi:MAG: Ig-like domain-containing protein [Candidatus Manganitrophus sp. SA1]|nr:Ig-like domain-containing protein [Candidatus Manganitrophus morganii]
MIATLAVTSTSGGNYSFDLNTLGFDFASDLIVRVVGPAGLQMRAFVSGETVHIDPVSEAAVQMILDQIAGSQGALNRFTPKELVDFTANVDLLTTLQEMAAGSDLEATVLKIREIATNDASLTAFIISASGSGQTAEAPGDIGNFFPFSPGNVWRFQGTISTDGNPGDSFFNTSRITGTKLINGLKATVFTETNHNNSLGEISEYYLVKYREGIIYQGNSDSSDFLTPALVPYRQFLFPMQMNAVFEQTRKTGLDLGEDLDGDGRNERVDFTSQVTMAGFESVTVPVGSFPKSVKVQAEGKMTITFSRNRTSFTATEVQTQWFASGVGPIKRMSEFQGRNAEGTFSETVTEELIGFIADGHGKGIRIEITPSRTEVLTNETVQFSATAFDEFDSPLPDVSFAWRSSRPEFATVDSNGLATGLLSGPTEISAAAGDIVSNTAKLTVTFLIAEGVANTESPGRFAVGFDGTDYLLVFCRTSGSSSGLFGVTISQKGEILKTFPISQAACPAALSVAFDGNHFLIAFGQTGQISGVRVSPAGVVLDGPEGFFISSADHNPHVSFNGTDYLVVFGKFINSHDVYGVRVTPAGQVSEPFLIAGGSLEQVGTSVAFDGTNHMVSWIENNLLTSTIRIFVSRVTPSGVVLDPNGILVSSAPGSKGYPEITFGGTNYFVVWPDGRRDAEHTQASLVDIRGARIKLDGTLLDGPPDAGGIPINTADVAPLAKWHPTVAFDGTNYFVIWEVASFSPPAGLFAARVTPEGRLIDGPPNQLGMTINEPGCFGCQLLHPVVSPAGENLFISWENSGASKNILGFIFPQ